MVEKAGKKEQKESKSAFSNEMASMMHVCSGLVGPKTGNVEKPLVFKCFFEGGKGARTLQEWKKVVEWMVFR